MTSTRLSPTSPRRGHRGLAMVAALIVASFAALPVSIGQDGSAAPKDAEPGFVSLFPKDGPPEGWVVRHWADVSKPGPEGATWRVKDGVLHGGEPRGSWLMSEKTYGDFILEYEFKLGERGNSGCALRSPLQGDPAFDGLELQMADLRYNTEAKESELTGGLYRALAPRKQVYRPEQWNRYRIELAGSRVKVVLNDTLILDHDLEDFDQAVKRHDGTDAPPLKDRPLRGHIGFQELSRGGDHVRIRHARIKVLKGTSPEKQAGRSKRSSE